MDDMKLKPSIVRQLREKRLWSQEELAHASGLSLRTIQRIESGSTASKETIKAIVAALEVTVEEIVLQDGDFEEYKHTQRADYLLIFLGLFVTVLVSIYIDPDFNLPTWPLVIFCLFLLVVGILFFSLTIQVTANQISWHFGLGFWRRTIDIKEVALCNLTRNSFWWGFGIRLTNNGWLYRVSGMLAVSVQLKGGDTISLGTDEPNYLSVAINNACSHSQA